VLSSSPPPACLRLRSRGSQAYRLFLRKRAGQAPSTSGLALVADGPEDEMPRDLFYAFTQTAKHNDVSSHYVGPLS